MAMKVENSKLSDAVELISKHGFQGMGEAMQIILNEAMLLERARYIQADPYERSETRHDYANGFKPKQLKTQIGQLSLQIPQVRNSRFYPSFIEKGLRSERALGKFIYVYLDARYEKIRQGGCVIDCAILLAYGVNENGKREILGISVAVSEAEIHWRQFLESLIARGLHGIKLLISDAHVGLRAATKAVFPSVSWQRCQFHLQQNAQKYVTRVSRKKEVAETMGAIFNAENDTEAKRLLRMAIEKYEKDMPQLTNWLQENIPEGLTIFQFPPEHRARLRTSNVAERINEEIRRRTKVVRIFPNTESCERLIGSIIMEILEGWLASKTYLTLN